MRELKRLERPPVINADGSLTIQVIPYLSTLLEMRSTKRENTIRNYHEKKETATRTLLLDAVRNYRGTGYQKHDSPIASSASHCSLGSKVLETYFSVYVAPFLEIESGLLKADGDYFRKNQYTGLQPAICEMLFVFRSISAYWNNRILNSLRDLCFSAYRGPPEKVLLDALQWNLKEKQEPETAVKVLFEWNGGERNSDICLETSFSIVVTDQPPRNNRQIAEDLADQIFHYQKNGGPTYDYRMMEKWISSCEAQSLDPTDRQAFTAFVQSQQQEAKKKKNEKEKEKEKEKEEENEKEKEKEKEKEGGDAAGDNDDALDADVKTMFSNMGLAWPLVDEMVIARILRDHSVDYTNTIPPARKKRTDDEDGEDDDEFYNSTGLPVVVWRRNQFTRARSALFGSQWPKLRRPSLCMTMRDYFLMQGCGVTMNGDGENKRDSRTYQTLKLFVCALDTLDPAPQGAKREWIAEKVHDPNHNPNPNPYPLPRP